MRLREAAPCWHSMSRSWWGCQVNTRAVLLADLSAARAESVGAVLRASTRQHPVASTLILGGAAWCVYTGPALLISFTIQGAGSGWARSSGIAWLCSDAWRGILLSVRSSGLVWECPSVTLDLLDQAPAGRTLYELAMAPSCSCRSWLWEGWLGMYYESPAGWPEHLNIAPAHISQEQGECEQGCSPVAPILEAPLRF